MSSFTSFYGLHYNPFDKENVRVQDMYRSHDYSEMLSRLNYLKDVRGIGVFTARPGMGKTLVLKAFSQSLNPNLFHMEYICLSTVSIAEFYRQFCGVLGVSSRGGKPRMFKAIQEQIMYLYKDKTQPLLLAVDEAQYLNTAILNDIKMLMNYEYDSVNCFSMILCGEPHFTDILRKPIHEALRQRITVHYEFHGLSDEEVPAYVKHKITTAGGAESIINDAAMASIHSLGQQNPRVIDDLMNDALQIGAQTGKQVIDADVILAAANNRQLG